jgi:cytochrome P450
VSSPIPITRPLPRPPQRFPGDSLLAMIRRPLEFLPQLVREQGDVAGFSFARQTIAVLSHPDDIRDVLVTNARNFHKGRGLERAKLLLGEGLLTSEGEFHLRQRRLAQPAFHRSRVMAYGDTMARYAERRVATWQDGTTMDLSREMATYTLAVVGKTLFDADIEAEAPEIGRALTAALAAFNFSVLPFAEVLLKLPFPVVRRFNRARARLDGTIYRLIRERRAAGEDRGDLLSMLLLSQDTEGDGGGMSDEQLRDEAMTILLAGHETTANALTWALYLVATHPEVEARLHGELATLGAAPIGADDVTRLPYTRAVLAEAMRLYPPAWTIGRRAIAPYRVRDVSLPGRTIVLMSQYIVHRDPRWWPNASRFDPARWMPGGSAIDPARPKFSYFPFGAGTRVCIGEQFAWMEGILALATIARAWRLEPVAGHPVIPQPIVTLRPKHGVLVIARQR